jgi:adenylate kinase family enzyme
MQLLHIAVIVQGDLVPMEILFDTLRAAIDRHPGALKFLLDGFPRSMEQIGAFERLWGPPDAVLVFDCDEATMRQRVLSRGLGSGRSDDTEAVVMRRFATFAAQTAPVIAHYASVQCAPTARIDARGTVDAVYALVGARARRGDAWYCGCSHARAAVHRCDGRCRVISFLCSGAPGAARAHSASASWRSLGTSTCPR